MDKINFAELKRLVPLEAAVARYGFDTGRSGMIRCPFHGDKTPSLKLYSDHFYCFGCHRHGDVIDFVAELFEISKSDAARKLIADFGVNPSAPDTARLQIPYEQSRQFREDQDECFRVLSGYLRYLKFDCAERGIEDPDDPEYREYLDMIDQIDSLCDIFITGSIKERVETIKIVKPNLGLFEGFLNDPRA